MTKNQQPDDRAIEESMQSDTKAAPDLVEDLRARLEETEREKDQFRNAMLRSAADLENYKKRSAQNLDAARERANERIIAKLIELADNFKRAVNYLPEDSIDPSWYEGISLTLHSLNSLLESEGVSRIEAAIGAPFDVTQHEAVFFEPTNDVSEGSVVRVVRDGYKLHSRVLRATQVSVAQPLPETPTQTPP